MSAMRVHRTTSKGQKKAKDTTTARRATRKKAVEPVKQVQVPDAAMEVAKALAGGDMSRVKVQRDGTVVVIN